MICKAGRLMVRVDTLDVSSSLPLPGRLGLLQGQCQVFDDFDQMAAGELADLFEALESGG